MAQRPDPLFRRRGRVPHGVQLPADAAALHGPPPRDSRPIIEIMDQLPEIPLSASGPSSCRNHDELTLEMVTDEERDYMYTEYAKDPRMRLNLGIRRRLAPLMDFGRHQIELLHSLLFTLPGSPVLYYGDEIGMGDNIFLGDRNGVARPCNGAAIAMQAFRVPTRRALSAGDPGSLYNFQGVNVECQLRVPVLAAPLAEADDPGPPRAQGLRPGEPPVPPVPQPSRRRLCPPAPGRHRPGGGVNNLSRFPQAVELDLVRHSGTTPIEMAGQAPVPGDLRPALSDHARASWLLLAAPRRAAGVSRFGGALLHGESASPTFNSAERIFPAHR